MVATVGLVMPACNDFLDRKPISSITPEQYFNLAEELAAYAVNYYTTIIADHAGGYNAGPINSDGDFPIITKVLQDQSAELIEASKRAPRNEVARFILEDLDRAISMLKTGSAYNKVRISRELALLMKAKVALFEGTFEKYHKGTPRVPGEPGWPGAAMSYNQGKTFNIDGEIDFFLTEAMSASKEVADNLSLTQNSKVQNPAVNQLYGWNPYFEMFSMPNPSTLDEVILWRQFDADLSVTHGYMPYIQDGGNQFVSESLLAYHCQFFCYRIKFFST